MAGNKSTPEPNTRHDFPEVKGKIVDGVELAVEADYYGVTIRFQDKTALTFAIEPCVFAFPIYEDWAQGESKIIKEYEPVQSAVLRT